MEKLEKFVIVGPGSQLLGVKIANILGINHINTEFKSFPDGEIYLRLNLEDETLLENKEIIIIQSTGPSANSDQNSRLFELLMIIDAVKRIGVEKISVIVPYLAYARQDKIFRPGESEFAKRVLKLIDIMGIDEFFVVDIHAPEVLEVMSCKTVNIDSMDVLAKSIRDMGAEDIVVVSPDKGAIERSKAFAKHFGDNILVDVFEKKRDVKTGEITMSGSLSLENKDVVIADDIIATGGTMATAIKLARKSGANKIYAAATHALMLQNAKYRILSAGADEIIGTDSIDNEVSRVSLANVITDYLK
ncbi:MAG: ribose-phosphate diphosphokinase [Candidatus Lokiarchaeota archaeon]|nr:ribose-phosphate diphosphokinase [Candidatus Lokiarchaeota archaeon]MBD3198798.1 ribose-phosphate diphosphokinase [Candidatus Lokiarchaeota archaeon]